MPNAMPMPKNRWLTRLDKGVLIPMPLARQDLADLLGTTVETSIRIMSRWGKDGVVLTRKEGFLVANPGVLERLALN